MTDKQLLNIFWRNWKRAAAGSMRQAYSAGYLEGVEDVEEQWAKSLVRQALENARRSPSEGLEGEDG